MPRDLNRHQCPVGRCTELLANAKLMCLPHWRLVPEDLQDAVYAAYANGAGRGSLALLNAQTAAIEAVEAKLAERSKS